MRLEYSIWLLALVVLFVANGRDGVYHVHGMVASHHRTHHHGEYLGDSKQLCHVSLIILFFSDEKKARKTFKKSNQIQKIRKYLHV